MRLPVAPHGAPGLEAEATEGKPAPEQGRFLAGQPRVKASALQQAFEGGHVVDVEAGNAAGVPGSSKALSRAEGISPCADALPRAMPCQRTAAGRCASAGAGRKWREPSNAARSPGGSRAGDSPNSARKAGGIAR